ncbi:unnamed protein product [Blepharisma stoltei]|uniref:PARP-type domain-containing protein n=1 Tax=Blepharisma stoltei TaxID=1481888 RepID=A0AAU9JWD4_9CILI|nr:unnamed protein product [Blepharisma stoltei]
MRKNTFQADIVKKGSPICCVCGEAIPIGDIRIKVQGYHILHLYHFKCYTPKVKQYICKNDVKNRLDSANAEILNNWIDEWNQDYVPLDKPFREPPQFSKLVESSPSRYRRAWLEIFKFLDAIEVFKSYSYVNKEFYHISWDQELWHFYCVRDYADVALYDQEKNYRSQYVIIYMESCFWCHTRQTEENFKRCPLIKKPICDSCKKLERFSCMCKKDIQARYGINPNILQLNFGEGGWGTKVVYRYMAEEAIESFRKRNKDFLLGFMKENNSDPTLIEFLEKNDIKNMPSWDLNENVVESTDPIYRLIYQYVKDKVNEKRLLSKLRAHK